MNIELFSDIKKQLNILNRKKILRRTLPKSKFKAFGFKCWVDKSPVGDFHRAFVDGEIIAFTDKEHDAILAIRNFFNGEDVHNG